MYYIFLLLFISTLILECRTYEIKNNTANVVRLDILRDHFSPRQIKLNAYATIVVNDLEDVYVQGEKQEPACTKQLNLIDLKTHATLATLSFNDACKNADVRINKDGKNKFKIEAKVK